MRLLVVIFGLSLAMFFQACTGSNSQPASNESASIKKPTSASKWTVPIRQLSQKEYPDNPDWETMHSHYDIISYKEIVIERVDEKTYNFCAVPANEQTDTLFLNKVNLMEWIPLAAAPIRSDEYLTFLSILYQEWNRQQVRFVEEEFLVKGSKNPHEITKVDLIQNALQAGLWELFYYAKDQDGTVKPFYHGWFDFPKDLYAQLFELRNPGLKYDKYKTALDNWGTPESKKVNLEELRVVLEEKELKWESYNQEFYVLTGERQRKQKNILVPKNPEKIQDFLTDKSSFASYIAPGVYSKKEPKKTELSRFAEPVKVIKRKTKSKNKDGVICWELEYQFKRAGDNTLTRLLIGGIQPRNFEKRSLNEVNKGWQMPMGIGNHSFYEYYQEQQTNLTEMNPYYAFLLDEKGNWIDSKRVGIDGPLFHWDISKPYWLHLWILGYERHAFVGHIGCDMMANKLETSQ